MLAERALHLVVEPLLQAVVVEHVASIAWQLSNEFILLEFLETYDASVGGVHRTELFLSQRLEHTLGIAGRPKTSRFFPRYLIHLHAVDAPENQDERRCYASTTE